MFDGLRGRKFYSRCKELIKLTKTRLEAIKKKRNAMQKYLKKDIVDLLTNNLDINAYGRVEGYLVELNMSSCYDSIEEYCGIISNHLSLMQKQRECPEECKEAVASLNFAAARFADLPDLRDLRSAFSERYGSLDTYLSKEFAHKLKSNPPTKDTKLQLMRDIANESSIDWDSKALEEKMNNSLSPKHKPPVDKSTDSNHAVNDEYKLQRSREDRKMKDHYDLKKGEPEQSCSETQEVTSNGYKRENQSFKPLETLEVLPPIKDNTTPSINSKNRSKPMRNLHEEEENKNPFTNKIVPPPYIKTTKDNKKDSDENDASISKEKPKPRSVRRRFLKPLPNREDETEDDKINEEERKMDGLLLHYSEKKPSYEVKQEVTRAASLPNEPSSPTEETTRPIRAASFQPEMMNPSAHVHPKLPDYDDLAARFAAIRGR